MGRLRPRLRSQYRAVDAGTHLKRHQQGRHGPVQQATGSRDRLKPYSGPRRWDLKAAGPSVVTAPQLYRRDYLVREPDAVLLQPLTAYIAYVAQAVVPGDEVLTPRPRAHSLRREAVALAHSGGLLAAESITGRAIELQQQRDLLLLLRLLPHGRAFQDVDDVLEARHGLPERRDYRRLVLVFHAVNHAGTSYLSAYRIGPIDSASIQHNQTVR